MIGGVWLRDYLGGFIVMTTMVKALWESTGRAMGISHSSAGGCSETPNQSSWFIISLMKSQQCEWMFLMRDILKSHSQSFEPFKGCNSKDRS